MLARKDLGLAQEPARTAVTPKPLSALCEKEMIKAMARASDDRDASIFPTLQGARNGSSASAIQLDTFAQFAVRLHLEEAVFPELPADT